METLAALGLASNIVRVVDFASKLVSTMHTLYVSALGPRGEYLELQGLVNNLQQLAENASPTAAQNKKLSLRRKKP